METRARLVGVVAALVAGLVGVADAQTIELQARQLMKCRAGVGRIEVLDQAGTVVPLSVFGALGGAYQALGRGDRSPRIDVDGLFASDGPALASAAGVAVSLEPADGIEVMQAGRSAVICFTGSRPPGQTAPLRLRLGASTEQLAALAPAYFPDFKPAVPPVQQVAAAAPVAAPVTAAVASPATERAPAAEVVGGAKAAPAAAPVAPPPPPKPVPPPPPKPEPPKVVELAPRATTLAVAVNAPNSVRYAFTESGAHLLVRDELTVPKGRVEVYLIKPPGRELKKVVLKGSRPEAGAKPFETEVKGFEKDLAETLTIGALLKDGYDHVLEVTWGPAG